PPADGLKGESDDGANGHAGRRIVARQPEAAAHRYHGQEVDDADQDDEGSIDKRLAEEDVDVVEVVFENGDSERGRERSEGERRQHVEDRIEDDRVVVVNEGADDDPGNGDSRQCQSGECEPANLLLLILTGTAVTDEQAYGCQQHPDHAEHLAYMDSEQSEAEAHKDQGGEEPPAW